MLMHITKSMHLVEMMNFLLFIITNLSSLVLLCSQRYQNHKKRNEKTRSIEVFEVVNYKDVLEDLQPQEVDDRRSISQAPKPQEMPQLQEITLPQGLASNPTQAPKDKPTVGSFDTPCCRGSRYGIHPPPIEAKSYEIKASLIRLIQESKFLGTKVENPYDHLDSFERLCDTFRIGGVPHDSIKLILFPFSLGGKASQWERTLPSHLVNSWDDCKEIFLNKFYSTQRTVQTRRDISNFKQSMHESFHKAWERLKGYTRDCPHHGFKKEAILSIFYLGVDQEHKWTLDAASNGRFRNLTVEQGELLVENFAQSEENYGDDYARATRTTSANEEQMRTKEMKALNERVDKQSMVEEQAMVLMTIDEHEKAIDEISNLLYGSKVDAKEVMVYKDDEVESPRVEHVGSCAAMDVVSSPKASFEKKGSCGERAFGYGNGEEAHALDGDCLASLFHTTIENEVESSNVAKKRTRTKAKGKNGPSKFDEPKSELSQPSTMTLTPWKHENGVIEYKIKCEGRSKPFAMVKAILTPELKEKGEAGLQEVMNKVLKLELKDPPWSAHTPLSPA